MEKSFRFNPVGHILSSVHGAEKTVTILWNNHGSAVFKSWFFILISGKIQHILQCATLLVLPERQYHKTTYLQKKSCFSSLLTDGRDKPSCSSFFRLLMSLLLLPDPHRTHNTAPALQTRMDDFTVLPGFPLWPRDLPLPSADISQQQRRTQLSGSFHSRITVQRARSDPRTQHPHLIKGSDSRHRIYICAQHDSFCFKSSFYSTHGGQPCLRCCHTARGKWVATGQTARSARCPLAAGCRTQAPFSPRRRPRDHQSLDRSAEPSEVKTRKNGRIRNINASFTSTFQAKQANQNHQTAVTE